MSAPDSPLATFRRAYFGPINYYRDWYDGLQYRDELACLDTLTPAEQAQAAAELLAGLRAGTADARAMLGLGHLRCAEALPLLHHCLRRNVASPDALKAIAQINPAGFYPPIVAGQLRAQATPVYQLIDLLVGLREYFALPQLGPAIPSLIFGLLTHADYLVRYHALHTLRHLYGSPTELTADALHDPQRIRNDEVFGLIMEDKHFASFGKAQHLLLTELPAATLARFPLFFR